MYLQTFLFLFHKQIEQEMYTAEKDFKTNII